MSRQVLLAAYALEPATPAERTAFRDGLATLPLAGLEAPLPPPGEGPWWAAEPTWTVLLTTIPTTMAALAQDPRYGLASRDEAGRRAALDDLRRAAVFAATGKVAGIEVPSAPGPARGSRDALLRSLDEILRWDLGGARVLVEHCDAAVDGRRAAKGFLELEDELVAVEQAGPASTVAVAVNWGRSAIEGRSAATADAHLARVRDAGRLGALVLSGASPDDGPWGPPWSDAHLPFRGSSPALAAAAGSLLGPAELARALASGPDLLAVKVTAPQSGATVTERLELALACLTAVQTAPAPGGAAL